MPALLDIIAIKKNLYLYRDAERNTQLLDAMFSYQCS